MYNEFLGRRSNDMNHFISTYYSLTTNTTTKKVRHDQSVCISRYSRYGVEEA